jgi:hypothetical protein
MGGTTSGSSAPRDNVALVVARLFRLKSGFPVTNVVHFIGLCFSNEGSGFGGEEQDPIVRETSPFIPPPPPSPKMAWFEFSLFFYRPDISLFQFPESFFFFRIIFRVFGG